MQRLRIGILSDTHGLVRPEVLIALQGSQRIIHAGDIGSLAVLEALQTIAPVTAVRGNCDQESWAESYPTTQVVEVEKVFLYILHDRNRLDLNPAAAGFHAVISGHSHRPEILKQQDVLYINPGSAGPSRFKLPVSVALLEIFDGQLEAQILELRH